VIYKKMKKMKKRGLHPSFFMLVWNYQMKENYIMAYVTYKNRTSASYRFTVDSLEDPAIAEFKDLLDRENFAIKRARKRGFNWGNTKGIRIRPRGPRKGNAAGLWGVYYDTPIANATRFDVYVRDYK
jgi:hypothetical protein